MAQALPQTDRPARLLGIQETTITRFVIRSLLLFNAVFLVQSLLDVYYLWGGLVVGGISLPDGMTYAQYAHRGAYPLVFTAILAGAFMLITFRDRSDAMQSKWARRLVYAWLLQNVLLLMSAALRLELYVSVYSLSRWRVAAMIWMGLIVFGFIWFLIRLLTRRDNPWMVRANVLTLFVVLYSLCFINVDAWIAGYNVRHCREISGNAEAAGIDLVYLQKLGPDALPAVRWLETNWPGDAVNATMLAQEPDLQPLGWRWDDRDGWENRYTPAASSQRIVDTRLKLEATLEQQLDNWRGWTWHRQRLLNP